MWVQSLNMCWGLQRRYAMTHLTLALAQEHPRAHAFLAATVLVMFKFCRLCQFASLSIMVATNLPLTSCLPKSVATGYIGWNICARFKMANWCKARRRCKCKTYSVGGRQRMFPLMLPKRRACSASKLPPKSLLSYSDTMYHLAAVTTSSQTSKLSSFFRVTVSAQGQNICQVINNSVVGTPFPSSV